MTFLFKRKERPVGCSASSPKSSRNESNAREVPQGTSFLYDLFFKRKERPCGCSASSTKSSHNERNTKERFATANLSFLRVLDFEKSSFVYFSFKKSKKEPYINNTNPIGMKIANIKSITLILVTFSRFNPIARISSDPTQVISAIAASLSTGASVCASSVIAP